MAMPSTPEHRRRQAAIITPIGPILRTPHETHRRLDRGAAGSRDSVVTNAYQTPGRHRAGQIATQAPSRPHGAEDGGISAWAGRIAASSPAPLSEAAKTSGSTETAEIEAPILIDGIERELWEVLTQEPESEDFNAAVRIGSRADYV